MASGSSSKDVEKALHAVFANSTTPEALPSNTITILETFLSKHATISESDSQKLHEELLNIHTKYVAKYPYRLPAFLQTLTILRSAIKGLSRLLEWWTIVLEPIINTAWNKKVVNKNVSDLLVDILDCNADDGDDGQRRKESERLCSLLLHLYLQRTRIVKPGVQPLTAEDTNVANRVEDVLCLFGRKSPKNLMLAIDRLVVSKASRLQALSLLCAFVHHQPPHLHTVSSTPLLDHLLKCLTLDTSSTVLSLALSTLIMLLPHIPTWSATNLPTLFFIYSRLLCWEQNGPSSSLKQNNEAVDVDAKQDLEDAADTIQSWDVLSRSFEGIESTPPRLLYYFTFLYGLYPLNFTSYIQNPRKYLLAAEYPDAEQLEIDKNLVKRRSEPFCRIHLLHANFFNTTLKDEISDNPWLKSDPCEVVSECMGLCCSAPVELGAPVLPPSRKLPQVSLPEGESNTVQEKPLLRNDEDSVTQAKTSPSSGTVPGTVWPQPPALALNDKPAGTSQSSLTPAKSDQSTSTSFASNISTSSPQTRDYEQDSPTLPTTEVFEDPEDEDSVSLDQRNKVADTPVQTKDSTLKNERDNTSYLRTAPRPDANVAYLQREVIMLKHNLNFQQYLKQQHLSHVGQLQRRHIKEATAEAETQNLINTNKSLKAKLAKADEAYTSLKKETATGRNQAKKIEHELLARLRTLKDEERKLRAENDLLTMELQRIKEEGNHLRRLVTESEARELLAQQEVASMSLRLEQLENLRKRVGELQETIRVYEGKELQYERANEDMKDLRTKLAVSDLHIKSRDGAIERAHSKYSQRVYELEMQVKAFKNPTPERAGEMAPQVKQMVDMAVSSLQRRYTTLESQHAALKQQFSSLEMRYKDLEQDGSTTANVPQVPQSQSTEPIEPAIESKDAVTRSSGSPAPVAANAPPAFLDHYDMNHPFRRPSDQPSSSSSFPSFTPSSAPVGDRPLLSGGVPLQDSSAESPWTDSVDSLDPRAENDVRSAFSDDSNDGSGDKGKAKERVYGRGGAQNAGMSKPKEDDKSKIKPSKSGSMKSGGFRGLRVIK